jgi:ABC-type amino acid transport substrate-binding protein
MIHFSIANTRVVGMIILTGLLMTCVSGLAAQTNTLHLVSDVWPPFTNKDPHRSFAEDIVFEALKRSGISSKTEFLEFEDVMTGIKQEKYDGSVALWYNEERDKYLTFSAPYLQNQLILVGRKGSQVDMKSFDELRGKRVAIVGNYAYGEEVEDAEGVVLVEGASDQANLELLLKEEVDYMLVDALLMQYMITHQADQVTKFLQIGTNILFKRSLHFAIRTDIEGSQALVERFNKSILKMVSDGSYHKILQLNWIRADVDGDGTMELIAAGERAGKQPPATGYNVWFQNDSGTPSNNRYYIEGEIYQGWDNVPPQYKVPPVSEEQEDFKLMKFGF